MDRELKGGVQECGSAVVEIFHWGFEVPYGCPGTVNMDGICRQLRITLLLWELEGHVQELAGLAPLMPFGTILIPFLVLVAIQGFPVI